MRHQDAVTVVSCEAGAHGRVQDWGPLCTLTGGLLKSHGAFKGGSLERECTPLFQASECSFYGPFRCVIGQEGPRPCLCVKGEPLACSRGVDGERRRTCLLLGTGEESV